MKVVCTILYQYLQTILFPIIYFTNIFPQRHDVFLQIDTNLQRKTLKKIKIFKNGLIESNVDFKFYI